MSVITLTTENFEQEALNSRVPVLIDFWASWCGPCKMMGPIVDQIAEEIGTNAKICKINIDEQRDFATKYDVMSIPTFILIKDGKEVKRLVGAMPKEELSRLFE